MATDFTKIATCCYCGSRTILKFDDAKHELTCRSCGAALHNLKPLKRKQPKTAKISASSFPVDGLKKRKKKKTQKRRRRSFSDLVDLGDLGDVFEDILDLFD
ncbi:MAG: hypothetical protein AAGJ34_02125 [Pseudomonadota bacterium]